MRGLVGYAKNATGGALPTSTRCLASLIIATAPSTGKGSGAILTRPRPRSIRGLRGSEASLQPVCAAIFPASVAAFARSAGPPSNKVVASAVLRSDSKRAKASTVSASGAAAVWAGAVE